MILKWLLIGAFSLNIGCLFAQDNNGFDRPDYKNIERITKDKSSDFYYPKIFKRYLANDTTLTEQQFKILYYGYFFQDGYSSFGAVSEFNDSLQALFKKDSLTDDDKRTIVRYTKADLITEPFSLRDIYRLYRYYNMLGDESNTELWFYKLKMLSKAIASTGDARSDTTGIHVLSIEDEYAIVSMLGFEFSGEQQLTENHCDYLTVKKNDDGIEGLYFDVKQIFVGYGKLFKEDKKDSKTEKKTK